MMIIMIMNIHQEFADFMIIIPDIAIMMIIIQIITGIIMTRSFGVQAYM